MSRSRFVLGPGLLFLLGVWMLWAVWWLALDVPEPPGVPPTPRLVLVTPAATLAALEAGPPTRHITMTPAPLWVDRLPQATMRPTATATPVPTATPTPEPTSTRVLATMVQRG